jgi:hypothetical protein
MPANATRFRLNDVVRAKRAADKAGIELGALELDPDGTIRIVPKSGKAITPSDDDLMKRL